jgi:hypothetical protein
MDEIEQLFLKRLPMRKACLCDERDRTSSKPVAWFRRGIDLQIDSQLDLVTAIVARPGMTDLMVADVRR